MSSGNEEYLQKKQKLQIRPNVSFVLMKYFTHEVKGLEKPIECLRL